MACGRSGIDPGDGLGIPPFGRGTDGSLVLTSSDLVVNDCWPLMQSGSASVLLRGAPPEVGRILFLHQTQDAGAEPGNTMTLDATNPPKDAGRWQLGVIGVVDTASRFPLVNVTVSSPLVTRFSTSTSGKRAQACLVREYENVTIGTAGGILALPWDAERGGVVALLIDGTLENRGRITASSRGFRGGETRGDNDDFDVEAFDTNGGEGGGKGEGLDSRSHSRSGRGNYWTGAGGGNAHNAGGGGGGGWGAGGIGGTEPDNLPPQNLNNGGFGGAGAAVDGRLMFGGGGGAGHENDGDATSGQNGGGIVMIFAARLVGSGSIGASSAAADASPRDGAGGGGGGGSIWLRSSGTTYHGQVAARGGRGGNTTFDGVCHGNGGGGGGGLVILDGVDAPQASVTAGTNGICTTGTSAGKTNGALPGQSGLVIQR